MECGIIKPSKEKREAHVYWNGRWNWSVSKEMLQQTLRNLEFAAQKLEKKTWDGSHFCDQWA